MMKRFTAEEAYRRAVKSEGRPQNEAMLFQKLYLHTIPEAIRLPAGTGGGYLDPRDPYPHFEYNMHNFSYFFARPSVSDRVRFEAAYNADFMNRFVQ